MDVHDSGENNQVTATFELPGLKKEDVQIDLYNSCLKISGESKHSEERSEEGYALRERKYGKFSRTLAIPNGTKVRSVRSFLLNFKLTRAHVL